MRLADLDPRWVDGPLLSGMTEVGRQWYRALSVPRKTGRSSIRPSSARTVWSLGRCRHRLAFTLWNPTDGLGILDLATGMGRETA